MNPFIPLESANMAIVDARISKEIEDNLNKLGIQILKTIKCEGVGPSIAYHPDIVIHPVNHKTLVICPDVFDYYKDNLKGSSIKLIRGESSLGSKYPDDIAYNVARIGKLAIHNFKYTDPILKYYLEKEGLDLLNIKQGYSKCSLAIVGHRSAITSDLPLYNKLNDLGFEVLLIQKAYIELKGQNYGFIGGTNGNIDKNNLAFSGSIEDHPDRDRIQDFISAKNINPIFLSKEKIVDIGTIITLNK